MSSPCKIQQKKIKKQKSGIKLIWLLVLVFCILSCPQHIYCSESYTFIFFKGSLYPVPWTFSIELFLRTQTLSPAYQFCNPSVLKGFFCRMHTFMRANAYKQDRFVCNCFLYFKQMLLSRYWEFTVDRKITIRLDLAFTVSISEFWNL